MDFHFSGFPDEYFTLRSTSDGLNECIAVIGNIFSTLYGPIDR